MSQVTNFEICHAEMDSFAIDDYVESSDIKAVQKKASLISDKHHELFSCLEKDSRHSKRAFQPYSLPETSRMMTLNIPAVSKEFGQCHQDEQAHFDFKEIRKVPCLYFEVTAITASDCSQLRRDVILIYLHANGEDIFDTYALCEALSKYLNVRSMTSNFRSMYCR